MVSLASRVRIHGRSTPCSSVGLLPTVDNDYHSDTFGTSRPLWLESDGSMTDAFVLNDLRVRAGATQLVHGVCLSVAPGEVWLCSGIQARANRSQRLRSAARCPGSWTPPAACQQIGHYRVDTALINSVDTPGTHPKRDMTAQ